MQKATIGLDIGGANLKAYSSTNGQSVSLPFSLWKHPDKLPSALAQCTKGLHQAEVYALTMTGELCDCWTDQRHGVHAILDAVTQFAAGLPVWVWTNQGRFISLSVAYSEYASVASANWLATAFHACKWAPVGNALLIDIGTTTTDIIPLSQGQPRPRGRTDPDRLASGELVYRGWKRTPVCAVGGLELAAELFATMHDVFLVLGEVSDDSDDFDTADGRSLTIPAAFARLARMYCHDPAECPDSLLLTHAAQLANRLAAQIASRLDTVVQREGQPDSILIAGSGAWLLSRIVDSSRTLAHKAVPRIDLSTVWGLAGSTAACALAVSCLAQEQIP